MQTTDHPPVTKRFRTFDARAYLEEYYDHIGEENKALLTFLHNAYTTIFETQKEATLLELGGGPTIYQLLSAARYPVTIDFSEYLPQNRAEVRLVLYSHDDQYNWEQFVKFVLSLESRTETTQARLDMVRRRVRSILHCDVRSDTPLGPHMKHPYRIVSVHFVPESITTDKHKWASYMDNILSLLAPDGYLVMSAIMGAEYYRLHDRYFPAVPVSLEDITHKLRRHDIRLLVSDIVQAEHQDQGYDGIGMLLGHKHRATH